MSPVRTNPSTITVENSQQLDVIAECRHNSANATTYQQSVLFFAYGQLASVESPRPLT